MGGEKKKEKEREKEGGGREGGRELERGKEGERDVFVCDYGLWVEPVSFVKDQEIANGKKGMSFVWFKPFR